MSIAHIHWLLLAAMLVLGMSGSSRARSAREETADTAKRQDSGRTESLGLIPQPVRVEARAGSFAFAEGTRVVADGPARAEAENLAESLRSATGLRLPVERGGAAGSVVAMERRADLVQQLGTEGYRLSIAPQRVTIAAGTDAGLFYGGMTLRQLMPAEAFAAKPGGGNPSRWTVPCVEIEDYPRFVWRGLLLDVARHYMPQEFLKKMIDLAALHKLNMLQLHLTDDQGWRVEIKRYPRLTEIGSVRKESPRHGDRNRGDGTAYGPFFYTQDQIREIVEYSRQRHVTLVPEIEMPGHFLAAMTAYPELSCTGGPFEVRTRWGVERDVLCPGNDGAIEFACNVLAEVMDLFPGRFIHIGGDEAPRERWKACAKCQKRMKDEGLKNEAQLQTYLNRRVEQFLAARGRRLVGWDEILEGGLTQGATVMSWRGIEGGILAANAGHDVVMSPTSHCYFDYAQKQGPGEPESIGGFIPLEKVYGFEPIPAVLPQEKRKHILGSQGNLWTEFMWTPRDVEYFAFPRAAALAEVVWTPAQRRNWEGFRSRLERHCERLKVLDVVYCGREKAGG